MRKDHDVPKRENGESVGHGEDFSVAAKSRHAGKDSSEWRVASGEMKTKARELRSRASFATCHSPLRFLLLSLRRDLEQRRRAVNHRAFRDLHLFDVFARREIEHHVGENLLDDRAQARVRRCRA